MAIPKDQGDCIKLEGIAAFLVASTTSDQTSIISISRYVRFKEEDAIQPSEVVNMEDLSSHDNHAAVVSRRQSSNGVRVLKERTKDKRLYTFEIFVELPTIAFFGEQTFSHLDGQLTFKRRSLTKRSTHLALRFTLQHH
jgi:hypothetical protein